MTRRIVLILVGAFLILALMFALWFWLFGKQTEVEQNLNGFGAADNRTVGTGAGGTGGNTQTLIGGTTDTSGIGNGSGGSNIQTPLYVTPTYEDPNLNIESDANIDSNGFDVSGISWLDGSAGGGSGGTSFNPTPINQVNNVSINGTAYFNSSSNGGGGGGVGLGGSLLGVAGGCLAQLAFQKGTVGIVNKVGSFLSSLGSKLFGVGEQAVTDATTHTNQEVQGLIDCMVRALARVAIQQITAQTVNWINSGFNGEPAFVQNFDKFFTDVADKAAGQVIQGSDLAFLCSPFQLQVRIAIAQSYARRSSGAAAQSCTLTQIVGNVEKFMAGDFSQGGWPGLISFTTVPTNNPFGAYAGAQVILNNRIIADTTNAERRISPGGFLSREECTYPTTPGGAEECKIITPGSTIEANLEAVLKTNLDSLQLADSVDQILNALVNSLVTNVFQKGLANLTSGDVGGQGGSAQDSQATLEARELLQDLQAAVQRAQQYGIIEQGSIADIQNAQANLVTLQNCWTGKNPANAQAAGAQVDALENRIAPYNNQITRANTAITQVQQVQSQALLASDLAGVRAAAAALTQAENSGLLISAFEVTSAQQNRTTLQSEMASINQQTNLGLNQCYAS